MEQFEYVCGDASYRGERSLRLDSAGNVVVALVQGDQRQQWKAHWSNADVNELRAALAQLEAVHSTREEGEPDEVQVTLRWIDPTAKKIEQTYWWNEQDAKPSLHAVIARIQAALRSISGNAIDW